MFYFYIIRLAIFLNLYFYAEKKDRVVKFELLFLVKMSVIMD